MIYALFLCFLYAPVPPGLRGSCNYAAGPFDNLAACEQSMAAYLANGAPVELARGGMKYVCMQKPAPPTWEPAR